MFPTPSISLHKRDVSQNDITPGFFDKNWQFGDKWYTRYDIYDDEYCQMHRTLPWKFPSIVLIIME